MPTNVPSNVNNIRYFDEVFPKVFVKVVFVNAHTFLITAYNFIKFLCDMHAITKYWYHMLSTDRMFMAALII